MKSKSNVRTVSRKTMYKALWPRGRKTLDIVPLARRLDTLEGKTICELWDGLFRGDEIFLMLEELISEQYSGVTFVRWTQLPRDGDHGFPDWKAHPNLLTEKGCDCVIVATGA
ncbi:MAG: hypothetical protein ABSH06_01325 [Thermodesulfobacteriota bacterium]